MKRILSVGDIDVDMIMAGSEPLPVVGCMLRFQRRSERQFVL